MTVDTDASGSDASLEAEIGRVVARAKVVVRRRLVLLATIVVLGVATTLLIERHELRHPVALAVASALGLLVIAGVMWWIARRSPGRFAPALPLGLDRARRAAVRRDLRRGTPSLDPVLREIEIRCARRVCRDSRWTLLLWPLVAMVQLMEFAVRDTTWRWFHLVCAVAFLAAIPVYWRLVRGARRMLSAV